MIINITEEIIEVVVEEEATEEEVATGEEVKTNIEAEVGETMITKKESKVASIEEEGK